MCVLGGYVCVYTCVGLSPDVISKVLFAGELFLAVRAMVRCLSRMPSRSILAHVTHAHTFWRVCFAYARILLMPPMKTHSLRDW